LTKLQLLDTRKWGEYRMRSRGACPPQRNYLTGLLLCFCLTTLLDGSLSSQQSPAATAPSTSPAQAQPGALPEAKPVQSSGQTKDDASQTGDSTKATSNDRLFFALPNFLTLENSANVPPLTVGQKFKVVARSSFDPVQFVWYGFLAGISQAQDSEPGYGQGRRGLCQALRGSFRRRHNREFHDERGHGFAVPARPALLPVIRRRICTSRHVRGEPHRDHALRLWTSAVQFLRDTGQRDGGHHFHLQLPS
jgi:hypothetical protein